MGCQWKELPIAPDDKGRPEIHHTRIYSAFRRWEADGCIDGLGVLQFPQISSHRARPRFLSCRGVNGIVVDAR
jgi:hypothetical protein